MGRVMCAVRKNANQNALQTCRVSYSASWEQTANDNQRSAYGGEESSRLQPWRDIRVGGQIEKEEGNTNNENSHKTVIKIIIK